MFSSFCTEDPEAGNVSTTAGNLLVKTDSRRVFKSVRFSPHFGLMTNDCFPVEGTKAGIFSDVPRPVGLTFNSTKCMRWLLERGRIFFGSEIHPDSPTESFTLRASRFV